MLNEALSRRYAAAVYEMAAEQHTVPEILEDLRLIHATIAENAELKSALFSPTLGADVKQNIAQQLFSKHVRALALHFYMLLLKKDREAYLGDIIALYSDQYNKDNGILEVKLEVAAEIDPQLEALVVTNLTKMTGKRIDLNVEVHPELVGGAVVSAGEHYYDGSLKNQLAELYKQLK
ncbi:ATP synthase F1 subunit delta [bacterium]|nr:ATP synthase F1 subunit delta [bacterium]